MSSTARRTSGVRIAGRRVFGWNILAVGSLALFLSGPSQTYGVSTFIDPILREMDWSRSAISTIYSLTTLASAAGVLLTGRLIDRLGHRRVMPFSVLLFAAGLVLGSVMQSLIVLAAAFAVIRTFGAGVLPLGCRTLIPQWFIRRRGRAFSVVGIAGAAGLALIPPFAQWLIDSFGWRSAWRIEACIIAAILVPAFLLLLHDRPEAVGLLPDGDPAPIDGAPPPSYDEPLFTLAQARRTFAFWTLLIAGAIPAVVVTGLSFNQVSIFTDRGLAVTLAATAFAIESFVQLPATMACGWLVDRVPPRYLIAASELLLAASILALLLATSPWLAAVFAILRGMAGGAWNVAFDVTWPSYFGRRHLGAIRGATFAAGVVGASIGPIPLGIVHDLTGSYNAAMIGLMVLPLAVTPALFFATKPAEPVATQA